MSSEEDEDIQKKFLKELSLLEQKVDQIENDEKKKEFLKNIEDIRKLWK